MEEDTAAADLRPLVFLLASTRLDALPPSLRKEEVKRASDLVAKDHQARVSLSSGLGAEAGKSLAFSSAVCPSVYFHLTRVLNNKYSSIIGFTFFFHSSRPSRHVLTTTPRPTRRFSPISSCCCSASQPRLADPITLIVAYHMSSPRLLRRIRVSSLKAMKKPPPKPGKTPSRVSVDASADLLAIPPSTPY